MKSINIEKLMGHSIGISDSYYRVTENELLDDYLKAIPLLTIGTENILQKQMEEVAEKSRITTANVKSQLYEKELAKEKLKFTKQKDSDNDDDDKESKEPDYDDKDTELEEEQEKDTGEIGEITNEQNQTNNQVL